MRQNQPHLRQAAGVIPVKTNDDGEKLVYLVQRSTRGSFFPGFHAFPGGAQEKDDLHVPHLAPSLACALRELFEETGMWPGSPPSAEQRRRLLAGELKLNSILEGHPLTQRVLAAGVRDTPDYSPIRFSAQFYLWEVHGDMPGKVWPGELEEGRWWNLEEARQAWQANRISLAAPTQSALEALHATRSFPEAAAALTAQPRETGDLIPVCPGWSYVALVTPTLPPARHTMCYLLGQENCLLVDPGTNSQAELTRLEGVLGGRRPQAVIFSHHHPDHIGGWGWARDNSFPVWAHAETSQRLPAPADRLLHDGELLDPDLRVLHTPGHAPGHIVVFDESRSILLAADLVSSMSTILVDPVEGDMSAYCDSLRRCRDLRPRLVLPSHGPPMGPGSDLLGRTLEHRLQREAHVLESLTSTVRTVAQLLPLAYADTAEQLWPIAAHSLLAHLLKLEKEGRCEQSVGGWRIQGKRETVDSPLSQGQLH